jgi:hypothetical protein
MANTQAYSVTSATTTIVADATLVIIHTASTLVRGSSVEILRAWASQHGTSTSQNLGILLAQKASAFGTYTSTTPSPLTIGGPASGITGGTAGAAGTAGTDASAEGAGAVTDIVADGFNNLNGYLWVPTPEERIRLPPDTAFILKIIGTPTTLTGWDFGVIYQELV